MTADDTIRQQAHRLVSAHGVDAPIQAAMRAQALLDQGDRAGSVFGGALDNMINVLLSKSAHAATVDPMNRDSVQSVVSVIYRNIAELRDAVCRFVERYIAQWIVEKNGYLSPAQARQAWHAAISLRPAA